MSGACEFSLELVKQFLLDKGGKVTNHELVKHFKGYLNDPIYKVDIRHRFKDYVNTLASVKDEGGTKYLILKKEYHSELHSYLPCPQSPLDTVGESYCDSTPSNLHSEMAIGCNVPPDSQVVHVPPWVPSSQDQIMFSDECSLPISLMRYQSSPSLVDAQETCRDSPPPLPKKKHSFDESPRRLDGPHPPPRGRKNHGRRGSQVEERVRLFSTEKDLAGGGDGNFKEKNLQDVTVSPGTVKEKTQIINRMSESNLLAVKQPVTHASVGPKRRDNVARTAADDDTTSVSTLDPRRREWLLRAAQADYHALARLLLEDAQLYMFEDFTSMHCH
ncbi:ankyrin repeat domain-containing protein SOWAHA-like [Ornithodoros turicata]|uniref:ankyrin repeat domain-containing protein SOWAHA-like n=1 Tax=Ornithodoros turicata TaxID=34597 RepID=UPI00313967DB